MYEKLAAEDRLIDAWIALEALFSGSGERTEISYRLSVRIAALLGTQGDRQALLTQMKKSYAVRSKIVHGAVAKGDSALTLEYTEEHLRDALRRGLDPGWPTTSAEWDTLILDS